jgi:ADP-ribosylglycohydrolase
MEKARESCLPSHDHVDSVVAAQVVVGLIYLGRLGWPLKKSLRHMRWYARYPSAKPAMDWHDNTFYVDAKTSVRLVMDFLQETQDWEVLMRSLIYVGGDTDTNCCIAASILEAYKGPPEQWKAWALKRLPGWEALWEVDELAARKLTWSQGWQRGPKSVR